MNNTEEKQGELMEPQKRISHYFSVKVIRKQSKDGKEDSIHIIIYPKPKKE